MFEDAMQKSWRNGRIGFGQAHSSEDHAFWPGEGRALERATPARQAEFAGGRAAARKALRNIGLVPFSIPMGADRAPVWPVGVTGSITHHNGTCLAVASRATTMSGLGLDLESLDPIEPCLWPEIMSRSECAELRKHDTSIQGKVAKIVFSAKEASYKALYPVTRRVDGFDAMRINLSEDFNRFDAHLARDFGPYAAGSVLSGQVLRLRGMVLTFMALPARVECGANKAGVHDMEMECFQ